MGGRLGETEDEDDGKDSSVGAGGGGGEGVCDGGGDRGGEELMVEPAEEEGTGAMKGNKDVKMGIGGEGVIVGEKKRQRRLERKQNSHPLSP